MDRFLRTRCLLGEQEFCRLQQAEVTIVGVGAVGGYVIEGLARAGVEHFRLVDFDVIEPSNINRQLFALDSTMYRSKVAVARERILDINPRATVEALDVFAAIETLDALLTPVPDLVIDAIDSLNPKIQLLQTVYTRGIPVISSMGAALRTDPAQIRRGDLMETRNCPLAKRVRKRLRRVGITTGIECVYSIEPVTFTYDTSGPIRDADSLNPYKERGRARQVLGSLPTLTGIFGLMIANMAIMRLARTGEVATCCEEGRI